MGSRTLPTLSLNDLLFIILGVAVLALAVLLYIALKRIKALSTRVNTAVQTRDGDEEIVGFTRDEVRQKLGQLNHQVSALGMAQQRDISRFGLVRFNPYKDTGGDLSFSLALATHEGNGVLITSLHSRSNSRIYAKVIQKWDSTYNLSAEEADAIQLAREGN